MPTPDPWAPLLEEPGSAAVLLDFDGSLAPIVDDPPDAKPLPESLAALAALVPVMGRVGVVSGRPVSFLRRALPIEGIVLAGLYGMERLVAGEVVVDPSVEPYRGRAAGAADDAERALPDLHVERKGEIACVIHWRRRPDQQNEALATGRQIADRHGMAAHPGRMSLEIRPPVEVDKGTAVESLADGMAVMFFAGDDTGDLAAFDALDRMEASGVLRYAVRVAVQSSEAPVDLLDRADERVSGPAELARVLSALADTAARA